MGVRIERMVPRSRGIAIVVRRWRPMWGSVRERVAAAGVALGVGWLAEYLLDPDRGRARRARLRDKAVHVLRKLNVGAGVLAGDVANRSRGVVAGTRYRFAGNNVDGDVLYERVRAELGRHVRHPHAVHVRVEDGVVTLDGDVLIAEESRALRALRRVPGVDSVAARWMVHADAIGVSALQGEGKPREPIPELLQEHWSPTARLLVGSAAVATWGASRGLPVLLAWPVRGLGAVLAARAMTNLPLSRITGITAGRRAIDIEDAITVAAPADKVWAWVSDYSQFKMVMPDVREVSRSADGRRSHWVINGPAGVPISFDAEETRREEGREIEWQTCDGQLVAHTGTLRLDPQDSRTRLQVRLSYNPVAGGVGHAAATLLRADPKHKLRDDLRRLKLFLETDTPPNNASPPAR